MDSIKRDIVQLLPHLQRYASHLTRNRAAAEDLVQDCVERAIRKSELFERGTDLRAWMFTMMRNIFINGKRRQGVAASYIADTQAVSDQRRNPAQFSAAVLARTFQAVESLSSDERAALVLLAMEQRSYREVSKDNGAPTGTMKSRLSRARAKLRGAVLSDDVL